MSFLRRRGEVDIEKLKSEIIRLIDENNEVIYKIAFYSQPEVQEILNKVLKRWESSGYRDRPIDHATAEELEVLYRIARRVFSRRSDELWSAYGREFLPTR